MDVEDLRTFTEVAETGGVAQAARRLGVAKSIVSRRLTRLEESLGVQLLARTSRGSLLTEAGTVFREHAGRVIAELETAMEALSTQGELQGTLRVAAPLSFGLQQIAPVLAQLALRHPRLRLDTAYSDRFVDLAAEGFDAAIRLGYLADSSLLARCIVTFEGRMVASPGYLKAHPAPKDVEDLGLHEMVTRKGEVWHLELGTRKPTTFRPSGRVTADNGEAVLAAALAGVGIAALPDFLVDGHIKAKRLVRVLPDIALRDAAMYVVRPAGSRPSKKVQVLTDILLEHFARAS